MQYFKVTACLSLFLLFATGASRALAAPGDLDLLFGINGKVITATGFSDEANAVALQADGKIVVAGYTTAFGAGGLVARYNIDGSLDTSFGNGGIVIPAGHGHGTHFKAVVVQPDGKIIAAGHFPEPGGCPGWRARIVRLNPDGSLDPTFNADGFPAGAWEFFFGCDATYFNSLALQPDGKIVIAGSTYDNGPDLDVAVIRLTANGELDTTFNLDGLATYSIGTDDEESFSVAVNPANGKIVVAGYTINSAGNKDMAFIGLTPSGLYDFAFGTSGKLTINFANRNDEVNAVLFRSDGKILAGGYAAPTALQPLDHHFAVLRLTSNGKLDTTFGKGYTLTNFGSYQDAVSALAVQADGKIVAVGKSENPSGTYANFALARYGVDGGLDLTFGTQGKLTTDFLGGADYGRGVAIQSDGKIVAAGSAANGSDLEIAVARYLP